MIKSKWWFYIWLIFTDICDLPREKRERERICCIIYSIPCFWMESQGRLVVHLTKIHIGRSTGYVGLWEQPSLCGPKEPACALEHVSPFSSHSYTHTHTHTHTHKYTNFQSVQFLLFLYSGLWYWKLRYCCCVVITAAVIWYKMLCFIQDYV